MPASGLLPSETTMKSLLKTFAAAAVLLAACSAPVVRAAVESGRLAPDFTFTDLAGKTQKLSDFRGKIVVLEWLNPACPYVVRHYRSGNLPATQKLAAAEGVVWLQINSMAMGDLDAAKSAEWQQKQGVIATAYIRDPGGKIGRLYGAQTTPHCFVIGRDGKLAYRGAIDDQPQASVANTDSAHNYVKAALTALKAGRPLEKTTTTPYGCEIKYGSDN
jgi:AhpC/TSA family